MSISEIHGIYGVDTGEIEVVNAETNEVIESFTISFFPGGIARGQEAYDRKNY